jgi:hypothetical protein
MPPQMPARTFFGSILLPHQALRAEIAKFIVSGDASFKTFDQRQTE